VTDRGEYRAIRRVLLDGPDFQKLPAGARWVFVALKLNLGPSGLEVWYPAELVARLCAQTGTSANGVEGALATLEREGWIQREGNVIWIVGQLANDPHVKRTDPKHRKMIQRHVDGLPRLSIVARYVEAHREWFTSDGSASGDPSQALVWAIEGPSKGHRSTKDKPEPEPEPEKQVIAPTSGAVRAPSWLSPYLGEWKDQYGGNMPIGPAAKAFAPLEKQHGAPEVLRRWVIYLKATAAPYANPTKFASTFGEWANPPTRTAGTKQSPAEQMAASLRTTFTPIDS
jgi:hypothetical protein